RLRPDRRVMSAELPGRPVPPPRPPRPPRPSKPRRLIRRIPPRLRRHWVLPAALVTFVAVAALVFGGVRITPIIAGDEAVRAAGITHDIEGTQDLFDDSVRHEVGVSIPDSEYSRMVEAYVDNGAKKWVSATVTIDGTRIENVGVRLKGNSTLMSLRGGGGFPGPGVPGGDSPAGDGAAADAPPGGDHAGAGPLGGRTEVGGDEQVSE